MKVERFVLGWIRGPAGVWRCGEDMDREIRFPVPAYLLETETERILFDTGLHPGAAADAERHYGGALGPFALEQERSIAEQVDLATITRVVLTHLHFDHAGGLATRTCLRRVASPRRRWAATRRASAPPTPAGDLEWSHGQASLRLAP